MSAVPSLRNPPIKIASISVAAKLKELRKRQLLHISVYIEKDNQNLGGKKQLNFGLHDKLE